MSLNSWAETLWVAPVAGPNLNTFTTAASLLANSSGGGPGKFTLPANFFSAPGKTLQIRAGGIITANATTTPTLTWQVAFGSVNVYTSQALSGNTTQLNNGAWELDITLVARAVGPSANVYGQGFFFSQQYSNVAYPVPILMPATSPTTGLAFDGTASQQVDLQAAFSASNANNLIQLLMFRLVAMN